MKYAALIVVLGSCGGSSGSAPDASVEAPVDGVPAGLTIEQVLPAGGQTVAIDEPAMYAVTIGNLGGPTGAITAMVVGSSDYVISTRTCTSLAPGGRCEVDLELTPSLIGAIDAQLVVTADPGGEAAADLHGTGLQKNTLQLTDRVDFQGQAVGQTSAPIPVLVTNVGAVTTGPLTVALGAGEFSLQADGCTGQSVASQGTCTFSVVYAPTTTPPLSSGGDFAGILVSGTPGGVGASTAAGYGATILMDEWQYLFADTAVGATSAPKTLTLTNTQSFAIGPLATDLQALGPEFLVQQDSCDGATLRRRRRAPTSSRFIRRRAASRWGRSWSPRPTTGRCARAPEPPSAAPGCSAARDRDSVVPRIADEPPLLALLGLEDRTAADLDVVATWSRATSVSLIGHACGSPRGPGHAPSVMLQWWISRTSAVGRTTA